VTEYEVEICETVIHSTTVEADNKKDAYNKAYEIIANGPDDGYETVADGFTGDVSIKEVTL
jgi:hypothetical protein